MLRRYIVLSGGYDSPSIEGGPFVGASVEEVVPAQEVRLREILETREWDLSYLDVWDDGRVELGAYSNEYLDSLAEGIS